MSVVSANPSVKPTALQMVNRVLRECAVAEVNSLSPGNPRSTLVLDALNDCVYDIHTRVLWSWLKTTYTMNFVAGQADYLLPGDFRAMAIDPQIWSTVNGLSPTHLEEVTPEEWQNVVLSSSQSLGSPTRYKVKNFTMTIDPVPTSDIIAVYPQFQFEYFRWPMRRLTTSDDNGAFDVPIELTKTLVVYGRSELKKFLEYPDWEKDLAGYEEALKKQLEAAKQSRKPYQLRPRYSSRWRI